MQDQINRIDAQISNLLDVAASNNDNIYAHYMAQARSSRPLMTKTPGLA